MSGFRAVCQVLTRAASASGGASRTASGGIGVGVSVGVAVGSAVAVGVALGGGVGVLVGRTDPQAESNMLRARKMAYRRRRLDFKAASPD
jgi:hypothetical protein